MKKVLFFAIIMALVVTTISCDNSKKSKHRDDDEEIVDDEVAEINEEFIGVWSADRDPGATMQISSEKMEFDEDDSYGYITTYNEFFEVDYTYVFDEIEVDEDSDNIIHVSYTKKTMEFVGDENCDPGNYDNEEENGGWQSRTVASGSLTITLNEDGKCSISSGERNLNHMILVKQN